MFKYHFQLSRLLWFSHTILNAQKQKYETSEGVLSSLFYTCIHQFFSRPCHFSFCALFFKTLFQQKFIIFIVDYWTKRNQTMRNKLNLYDREKFDMTGLFSMLNSKTSFHFIHLPKKKREKKSRKSFFFIMYYYAFNPENVRVR